MIKPLAMPLSLHTGLIVRSVKHLLSKSNGKFQNEPTQPRLGKIGLFGPANEIFVLASDLKITQVPGIKLKKHIKDIPMFIV